MDREEIKKMLPHREPMLLLDELHLEGGKSHGTYRFRGEEWFFQGHFPGEPMVPGLILCEVLAQSASLLIYDMTGPGCVPYLVGMHRTRFKKIVRPGDLYATECELVKMKKPFYFFRGIGKIDGEIGVKADFSIAVYKWAKADSGEMASS